MKVLMLLTDAYGCLGGIAKFNRDFLDALNASPRVERTTVWPRRIAGAPVERIPESVVYERAFASGKWAYIARALSRVVSARIGARPAVDLVICGHIHLLPLAWLAAKAQRAPLALILYGIDAWRPTSSVLANWIARKVDGVLSISDLSATRFRSWSKTPADRFVIAPCCVDLALFTPGDKSTALLERYGLGGCKVLMTMGRLAEDERYKGFNEIIELLPRLLQRFPALKYLVVGDGGDRARLAHKAQLLGVDDRVVFAGAIREEEKVEHYRLADVFAMPSTGEGFGIVLIEAAACGVKLVGSSVDGSREALLDGALGALVDPRNVDALFAALTQALADPRPPARNDAVRVFDTPAFQARIAAWLETQAAARAHPRDSITRRAHASEQADHESVS